MAQRDSSWPLYLSTAFVCIVGLWALYLWQLRLDQQWNESLAMRRNEAIARPQPRPPRPGEMQVAPPVRISDLENNSGDSTTRFPAAPQAARTPNLDSLPSAIATDSSAADSNANTLDRSARRSSAELANNNSESLSNDPPLDSNSADEAAVSEQTNPPSAIATLDPPVTDSQPVDVPNPVDSLPALPALNSASATPSDPATDHVAADGDAEVPSNNPFRLSSSAREVAPLDQSNSQNVLDVAPIQDSNDSPIVVETPVAPVVAAWPRSNAIHTRLEQISQHPALTEYAARLQSVLQQIEGQSNLGSEQMPQLLQALALAAEPRADLLEQVDDRTYSSVDEVRFEIAKRIEIWRAVARHAHEPTLNALGSTHWTAGAAPVERAKFNTTCVKINELANLLGSNQVTASWIGYLALPELYAALSDHQFDAADADLVRRVLRRSISSRLTREQIEYLSAEPFASVLAELRNWLEPAPGDTQLLSQIESYEETLSPIMERQLSRTIESLLWSSNTQEVELGNQLETSYRNANLRFTISGDLLNRLVPESMQMNEPVNDRVLGARVTGISQTENRLRVRLIPDSQRWFLGLEAQGVVSSRTRAIKDGIIFHDQGTAWFEANKYLSLDRNGINFSDASAQASSSQRMTGIESDYDALPLIGPLARAIAIQKRSEQEPLARRIVENRVAQTASDRMDDQIRERFGAARQRLQTEVIDPLLSLGLEPQPIELATTDQRLILRYRVAGFDQLAATTPRPQALDASLISFQIHESAINNFLGSLVLGGQAMDLAQLSEHLSQQLGRPVSIVGPTQQQVAFQFPEVGALRLRFDDGVVRIRIHFESIELDGKCWSNIEAEAEYTPAIEGCQLVLVRAADRAVTLRGDRLRVRDQLVLRGVMNVLFDPKQTIEVIPEVIAKDKRLAGTVIGQLVIENGWIGVSIVDQNVANSSTPETRSVGFFERLRSLR